MVSRLNIFSKIVIMLILLLIPILLLYAYTNQITNKVLQERIETANMNQLSFAVHGLDSNVERLSMLPVILGSDPYIREYVERFSPEPYDVLKAQSRITEKLSLQSVSSGWRNELTIVLPKEKQILSSSIFVNGTTVWPWDKPIYRTWTYEDAKSIGGNGRFVREVGDPTKSQKVQEARVMYQVRFGNENIVSFLNAFKQDRNSDPFLYHPSFDPIVNTTVEKWIVGLIVHELQERSLHHSGQEKLLIENEEYLVSYMKTEQLGWYLVDYVPVQKIMSPILTSRQLFYASIALLLLICVLGAYLLYRNVQIPIVTMIRSVQRLKRGDLSSRIERLPNNEFDYLIVRFNEMAEQIQVLVEDVYAEKIRSREATLKQLQSQIQPHFLYNSLFFIINSAELEDKESVVEMAHHLAEFYRYTTRVETQTVRLEEELDLVRHYLSIQQLRIHRLHFEIRIPDELLAEELPRLTLQPIVENAIVHGIERSLEADRIVITGEQGEEYNRIIVEDNGPGVEEGRLALLRVQLEAPMSEDIGCGTWNVHHRLSYQYGQGSGLTFERGSNGGLRVVLSWRRKTMNATLPAEGG
ncbi:sensor histidine kinase [Paenibacillus turpanensis]|uniref:sensor histidine kinase n=1 Tax=Paenibacillus turpanensis TaxID=2689078 RepID=UPI00140DC19C|nr:histidine kinase [Paenibacillus turpanensis]